MEEQKHPLRHLLGLIDEAWHGGQASGLANEWSYFSEPETGLHQTLEALNYQQADRILGNNSLAQQVQHTTYGNRIFTAWIRGEEAKDDWDSSWQVGELDQAGWDALKQELWQSLAALRSAVEQCDPALESSATPAYGGVSHLLYHLGAIRAKATLL